MSEIIVMGIKILAAVAVGFLAGHAAVFVFNRVPAVWLCDYGQDPGEELKNRSHQRLKGYPWKLLFSGFFAAGAIHLILYDVRFSLAALVFCWALLEIAIADKKYGIIPDQFVLLTAAAAIGFVTFQKSFLEPVWGVLLGTGIMLLAALTGKLLFKQESLGFGDVKLFAAMGLALGFKGTLTVLILSSLSCALYLSVLLIKGRVKKDDMVPIGPCICAAGIFYVVIIWPLL